MSSGTHISTLYRECADALRTFSRKMRFVWQVVADSQGRALQKHPDYTKDLRPLSEHGYFLAVEMANRRFAWLPIV
jgi:hypothetical protein